jgi:DNA-directed RNA polymerase I, II, and III subunit RPABC1
LRFAVPKTIGHIDVRNVWPLGVIGVSERVVSPNDINKQYRNKIDASFPNTEIFKTNELMINIVDHVLVPKHTLLSTDDSKKVLEEYNARKRDMPKILKSDAIAKYYNMPVGRICRITRNSETSGESFYYRLVVNDFE